MSRHGYVDGWDENWAMICWRGAVASAIRGKRGQALLRELRDALDAMPEKRLVGGEFRNAETGNVCALGCVGVRRGLDLKGLNESMLDDRDWATAQLADELDVAEALVREIMWENDDGGYRVESDEGRWQRMRRWVEAHINGEPEER